MNKTSKPQNRYKSSSVVVRLTKEQYQYISEKSKIMNITVSECIRNIIHNDQIAEDEIKSAARQSLAITRKSLSKMDRKIECLSLMYISLFEEICSRLPNPLMRNKDVSGDVERMKVKMMETVASADRGFLEQMILDYVTESNDDGDTEE